MVIPGTYNSPPAKVDDTGREAQQTGKPTVGYIGRGNEYRESV
jgi:hypothetical protein